MRTAGTAAGRSTMIDHVAGDPELQADGGEDWLDQLTDTLGRHHVPPPSDSRTTNKSVGTLPTQVLPTPATARLGGYLNYSPLYRWIPTLSALQPTAGRQ